ncbi:MAG: papain fold toxin domain-containing protein [Planktothrix sp.]
MVPQFSLLECDKCATAVFQWLKLHRIEGKLLRIRTAFGEDYIVSKRLENQGITESITVNGTHYGVEVQGQVFDNLSSDGLPRREWIQDFHCIGEQFIVEELEILEYN